MKINVIFDYPFWSQQLGGLYTAYVNHVTLLKKMGITIKINSLTSADVTHIHTVGPLGIYHLMRNDCPKVISAHTVPSSINGTFKADDYWGFLAKPVLRHYYNLADAIFAVSPLVRDELTAIGINAPIRIVTNSVDETLFKKDVTMRNRMRQKYAIGKSDIVVLGAGQLQKGKGIEVFFQTARRFPNIKFIWAGGKRSLLTDTTLVLTDNDYSVPPNGMILDPLQYRKMPTIYNMADIFFFPSWRETAGMVIIEAASCGLPLVLRDLPVYESLYTKNYLKGKTVSDFAECIKTLTQSPSVLKHAKINTRKIAKTFSSHNQGTLMLREYQKLIYN